jgi:para-nitrobenzyl esterase
MSDAPVVETRSGRLRGELRNGVCRFLGIPYGASTAGANRFRAPQPVQPWAGIRDAQTFRPACPQLPIHDSEYFAWYHPAPVNDEDCLHLNVYTCGAQAARRRPVMVWLHGGGFISGSGSAEIFEGSNLTAYGDIVLVTVTHRLGILGFLRLDDHGAPDSGNAAMLDMVAALQWVRDNIEAFGGDPGNVTLFGQSGGTGKISTLLAMPAASGLFHKAIMQSGCALILRTAAQAERHTHDVLAHLPFDGRSADSLRHVPVEQLLASARAGGSRFGPYVDGRVVPRHPCEPDAPAVSRGVSLIIGSASHEASYAYKKDVAVLSLRDFAEMRERVMHRLHCDGAAADRLISVYRQGRPQASAAQVLIAIESDYLYRLKCIQYAERKAALGGAPVYMYLLSWVTPALEGLFGAPHTACVPLVFRNQHQAAILVGDDTHTRDISDRLCEAWMGFARSGVPQGPGLPEWKPYGLPDRATLIFDRTCRLVSDPDAEERLAIGVHGPHANYISARRQKFASRTA